MIRPNLSAALAANIQLLLPEEPAPAATPLALASNVQESSIAASGTLDFDAMINDALRSSRPPQPGTPEITHVRAKAPPLDVGAGIDVEVGEPAEERISGVMRVAKAARPDSIPPEEFLEEEDDFEPDTSLASLAAFVAQIVEPPQRTRVPVIPLIGVDPDAETWSKTPSTPPSAPKIEAAPKSETVHPPPSSTFVVAAEPLAEPSLPSAPAAKVAPKLAREPAAQAAPEMVRALGSRPLVASRPLVTEAAKAAAAQPAAPIAAPRPVSTPPPSAPVSRDSVSRMKTPVQPRAALPTAKDGELPRVGLAQAARPVSREIAKKNDAQVAAKGRLATLPMPVYERPEPAFTVAAAVPERQAIATAKSAPEAAKPAVNVAELQELPERHPAVDAWVNRLTVRHAPSDVTVEGLGRVRIQAQQHEAQGVSTTDVSLKVETHEAATTLRRHEAMLRDDFAHADTNLRRVSIQSHSNVVEDHDGRRHHRQQQQHADESEETESTEKKGAVRFVL